MVEHSHRPAVAHFFAPDEYRVGATITLNEDAAHHIRVVRLGVGERVGLRDGAGGIAGGVLIKVARSYATVELDEAWREPPPSELHVIAPIGDRDRMLTLAEKCVEIGITTWRPVLWRRSRSVSPRGDGPTFAAKVRARMVSALLQSHCAWLPDSFPDATPERAAVASSPGVRVLLDASGASLATMKLQGPVTIAIGPEGGVETEERDAFQAAGFVLASLGSSVLRFETAGIVAVGLTRAIQSAGAVLNG